MSQIHPENHFFQSSVALESAEPPLTFPANLQEAETEIARFYT